MTKQSLLPGSLLGCVLGFVAIAPSVAAQTNAPNEWTWMGGSSTVVGSGGDLRHGAVGDDQRYDTECNHLLHNQWNHTECKLSGVRRSDSCFNDANG